MKMNPLDFEQDLRDAFEDVAINIGFKLAKGKNLPDTILDYLTVRNRLIESKRRQVLICPDLCFCLNNPPIHPKKKEIDTIINIARQGGNLNPFLSTQVIETNPNDYMCSEWHIYHLHTSLTRDKKKPNFVKRSNLLLFVYIDDEYIVFLGAEKHSEEVFADTRWLRLIYTNFPYVLEKYKDSTKNDMYTMNGGLIDAISPIQRSAIRKGGLSLGYVKIDDAVYINPGIGIMSSGHAMLDAKQTDSICNWMFDVKRQLTQYYDTVCSILKVNTNDAVFKILFPENMPDKLCLCEITTRAYVLEFPQQFSLDFIKNF